MRWLLLTLLFLTNPAWADTVTMFGGNTTNNLNNAATNYISGSADRASGGIETNFQFPIPISGTATALYCIYGGLGTGPGVGNYRFRLRVNTADTAAFCDITGALTTACNITGQSIALAAGDKIAFSSVPSTSPVAGTGSCSVAVTITSAATRAPRRRPMIILQNDLAPLRWFLQTGSEKLT